MRAYCTGVPHLRNTRTMYLYARIGLHHREALGSYRVRCLKAPPSAEVHGTRVNAVVEREEGSDTLSLLPRRKVA